MPALCKNALRAPIVLILVCLFAASTSAQTLFPVLGAERAGTTSMTFLKIGVGARAEGMAGAFVAVADDPSCLYWNPAGLVRTKGDMGVLFNFVKWPADIQYAYLGWTARLDEVSKAGLFAAVLSLPDFEETTETQPHGTGRYVVFEDLLIGASYSRALTHRFSASISLKFARETLDDLRMNAFLGDIGTLYYTGLSDLRLGAALQHFGPNMRPGGTYATSSGSAHYEEYPPPTLFRLGAAGTAWKTDDFSLLLAIALEHPVDNAENIAAGAEFTVRNIISLRAGRKINRGEETWTAGAGLRIPYRGLTIALNYAYTDFGRLDLAQRYSSELLWK